MEGEEKRACGLCTKRSLVCVFLKAPGVIQVFPLPPDLRPKHSAPANADFWRRDAAIADSSAEQNADPE
ncbi:MAG: hypothetical protein MMC33_009936 [Icmadophila ericetorum]|nr:hypothetical protein [Icmadophila ericetorum]